MLFVTIAFNLGKAFGRITKHLFMNTTFSYETYELYMDGSRTFSEGVPQFVLGRR